jgi:hypothetical protein
MKNAVDPTMMFAFTVAVVAALAVSADAQN